MPSDWIDSARKMLGENPALVSRILRELLKVELPPVIQYTVLTSACEDPVCEDQTCEDSAREDDGPPGLPAPEMIILAGPVNDPVRAIVVEFLPGRDSSARRRWPHYAAAVWLIHGCPVDLFVLCPDDLTAHWADRPIATTLDDYVCHPVVLVLEDLGPIALYKREPMTFPADDASAQPARLYAQAARDAKRLSDDPADLTEIRAVEEDFTGTRPAAVHHQPGRLRGPGKARPHHAGHSSSHTARKALT